MADEQKPGGSDSPLPGGGGAIPKPAPPKPAAPAPPKPPAVMSATEWTGDLAREMKDRFSADIVATSTYLGQNFAVVTPGAVVPVLEFLKLEADFDYLVDITAVDWPKRAERFDLVYVVYSFFRNERMRLKTQIPDGFQPRSGVGVHLTANWLEREIFDMFGITFAGHPDLRRILMPDGWQGYPLRKDYGILQQDDRWVRENLGIESGQ